MVALAPVLVAIVGCREVYLPAEALHLLAQGAPEFEALGGLERAGLQRDLKGGDEIPLWHSVDPALPVNLVPPVMTTERKVRSLSRRRSATGAPTPVWSITSSGGTLTSWSRSLVVHTVSTSLRIRVATRSAISG